MVGRALDIYIGTDSIKVGNTPYSDLSNAEIERLAHRMQDDSMEILELSECAESPREARHLRAQAKTLGRVAQIVGEHALYLKNYRQRLDRHGIYQFIQQWNPIGHYSGELAKRVGILERNIERGSKRAELANRAKGYRGNGVGNRSYGPLRLVGRGSNKTNRSAI